MAKILKIGTAAQYTGGTAYNLVDYSNNNIFTHDQGRMPEREDRRSGFIVMHFRCSINATTVANRVNQEQELEDHLIAAEKYLTDLHYDTPVYLYDAEDGETVRRAVITGGTLEPELQRVREPDLHRFYMLSIYRGPWEGATETTAVNAVEFDGTTPYTTIAAPKGDIPGRISEFRIEATSDNLQTNPLTKVWGGFRPEYGGVGSFDPIWPLQNMTSTVGAVTTANANCYGSGNNAVKWLGASSVTKIGEISLLDVVPAFATNIVVNGGAETGDLTGWVEDTTGWAASTAWSYSGTSYGFYSYSTGAQMEMHQYRGITPGEAYKVIHRSKMATELAPAGANMEIAYIFCGSSLGPISFAGYDYQDSTHSWQLYESVGVAPTSASFLMISLSAGGGECAYDNIASYPMQHTHWRGEYLALLRCKTTSGEFYVSGTFGYVDSDALMPIGDPQSVTHTDWKWLPLGMVSFPPGRQLTGEEAIWRLSNLGFEIYGEEESSGTLYLNAIALIPYKYRFHINKAQIARSSYFATDGKQSDLIINTSVLDEKIVTAESAAFTGVNTSIEQSVENWGIPPEDCILVTLAERETVHTIADDYTITVKYFPRYRHRNTD